jgi:peptidylprolyl isomerase
MKKEMIALALAPMLFWSPMQAEAAESKVKKEDIIRVSETFGHLLGRNLENPGITFDLESIIKGMRDATAGKDSPMSDEEYEELLQSIQEQAYEEISLVNLEEANAFLSENAKHANIIQLNEGKLQYIILKEGNGAVVTKESAPLIHYHGVYMDGTVFGSSTETGEAIPLPLDDTIPGFANGISGMREGEKRRLFIHPDLAYGTSGVLPPNTLLTFDIEVVKAHTENDTEQVIQVLQQTTNVDELMNDHSDYFR